MVRYWLREKSGKSNPTLDTFVHVYFQQVVEFDTAQNLLRYDSHFSRLLKAAEGKR